MNLDPDLLLQAYASGIFPMADSRGAADLYWVEPRERAIIPLDGLHVSRSLHRTLRSGLFTVTCNRSFGRVVAACADREETWINHSIEQAVADLHERGHAHSIEVWRGDLLVGGLYGVSLGRAFFGESMFSRERDASKVALAWLVARMKVGRFALLDCQIMTDHLRSMGAITVSRDDYVALLVAATGGATGSGVGSTAAGVSEDDGEAPDFRALDALLDRVGASGAAGPSGYVISQLLTHTS